MRRAPARRRCGTHASAPDIGKLLAEFVHAGGKVVRIRETDILSEPQEAARSIYAIVRRTLLE
ncbi:MAG TPA: hypothetical protein VMV10_09405 [Pirellulales bacterium]|nr:hypothetical protein [Pirellulales bacterium]